MREIDIRIGDKTQDEPLFPELADAQETELIAVAILEAGMESGQPSLWLVTQAPDGRRVSFQMSYFQWDAISGALRGSMARWALAAPDEGLRSVEPRPYFETYRTAESRALHKTDHGEPCPYMPDRCALHGSLLAIEEAAARSSAHHDFDCQIEPCSCGHTDELVAAEMRGYADGSNTWRERALAAEAAARAWAERDAARLDGAGA